MIETILKGINNRDIASLFWIVIVSLFVIIQSYKTKSNVLAALKNVLRAAFNYRLIVVFLILLLNTICSAYLLKHLDLWDLSQVKNTVIWLIFTGLTVIGKAITSKNYNTLLNQTVWGSFKLIIFLEFFINLYVFNLLFEIFLVFIITCLLILSTYIERSTEEDKMRLYKLFSGCISIIVFLMLIITTYKITDNPQYFLTHLNFLNLITPITLTVLSLPSILIIFITTSYEDFFTSYNQRLNHSTEAKPIKLTIMRRANFKVDILNRLSVIVRSKNILTVSEIHDAIDVIEKHRELEKNPPAIPLELGWSPYLASKFIEIQEVIPTYYKNSCNEKWFAESNSYKITNDLNNIRYHISGTENHVTCLSLKLNITNVSTKHVAIDKFCVLITQLYLSATHENIADIFLLKILDIEDLTIIYEYYKVSIEVDNHMYGDGLSINFAIKNYNHVE